MTDANNNRAEMTFDGHDRQRRWIFPSKTVPGATNPADYEEYGYDLVGNRTSLRKRDGQMLLYTYDNLDRVIVKDAPGPDKDVRYAWDARGLQTGAWYTWTGEIVSSAWDGFGRPLSSTVAMGGVTRTIGYAWDVRWGG